MTPPLPQQSVDESLCPARHDGTHCNCWWDGMGCHSCGAPPMGEDEKIAQGMVEGPLRAADFGCAFAIEEERRLGSSPRTIATTGERS